MPGQVTRRTRVPPPVSAAPAPGPDSRKTTTPKARSEGDPARCVSMALSILLLAGAAACGSTESFGPAPSPATTTSTQVTPLQPAASVAHQLGLTGFTDCGEVPAISASDSGTAYGGSELIMIDIFPSQAARDEWVSTATGVGIVPVREGGTWVAYKSPAQSAPGC